MPQGLQAWDAAGNLVIDIDTRLMRTLTTVTTGTTDGSMTVSAATQGSVVTAATNTPADGVTPTVSVSGTTVSWSFGGAPAPSRRSVDLIIMVC